MLIWNVAVRHVYRDGVDVSRTYKFYELSEREAFVNRIHGDHPEIKILSIHEEEIDVGDTAESALSDFKGWIKHYSITGNE